MGAMGLIGELDLLDWDGTVAFKEVAFALTDRAHRQHISALGGEVGEVPRLAAAEREEFVDEKTASGYSAGQVLATQLLIKALSRRIFYKGLKRGVVSKDLGQRLHVSHLTGTPRMKEVQVCEILLRALRHLVHVPGGAHVDEDVWKRVPDDYDLDW